MRFGSIGAPMTSPCGPGAMSPSRSAAASSIRNHSGLPPVRVMSCNMLSGDTGAPSACSMTEAAWFASSACTSIVSTKPSSSSRWNASPSRCDGRAVKTHRTP